MDLDTIIDELQKYKYINEETISDEKSCINEYQIEFLDGFIEVILDKCLDRVLFEVYINIKNKDNIADSLLYKMFYKKEEAEIYFNELKKFIDSSSVEDIINGCKIRL